MESDKTESTPKTSPGVIYLSRIPSLMSVKKIRQVFLQYGEVGRIFLQPDEKAKTAKKKFKNKRTPFSEGWVEFKDKHVAKRVAFSLNNTQISNKRSNRWFDEVWNIKYLPKFHWGHLNERLAYERAVRQQKLRAEITQAKKETGYFVQGIEKTKILQRLEKKRKLPADKQQREWSFKQKDVDDDDAAKSSPAKDTASSAPASKKLKRGPPASAASNTNFLRTLFSGGVARRDNNVTQNNDAAN